MSRVGFMADNGCDPHAAAEFLRALAHPMRLQILCRLLEGELSVAGLESELGLRQPSLSQQLGQLREAGLVTTRREAKSVYYSLTDQRVRGILDSLRDAMSGASRTVAPAPELQAAKRAALRPQHTISGPSRVHAARAAGVAECGFFSVAGWPARD